MTGAASLIARHEARQDTDHQDQVPGMSKMLHYSIQHGISYTFIAPWSGVNTDATLLHNPQRTWQRFPRQ
jgi:hypothetical protein